MFIRVEVQNGDLITNVDLHAKYEVCEMCNGHGSFVNPAIDGIPMSEFSEWDDESQSMYFSGGYDVACYVCNGERVVKVVDIDYIDMNDPLKKSAYDAWSEDFEYDLNRAFRRRRNESSPSLYSFEDY